MAANQPKPVYWAEISRVASARLPMRWQVERYDGRSERLRFDDWNAEPFNKGGHQQGASAC
jgi:hypothetical protein